MKIQISDKSLMMILLLENCNLKCAHCVRQDEPMPLDYQLSFAQLETCLSDCRRLESIRWVHFSGGEPTLWTEGSRGLIDLLLTIAGTGYTPGFTTNGSYFTDYGKCQEFFSEYVAGSDMPLRLYLSIDTFHHNFDKEESRAPCLDNVLRCKRSLPLDKAKLLDIAVLAVISRSEKSLLPDEMIRHYESQGVSFVFVPLAPRGKALSFRHLCPDLESDNPEDLGAYGRYHREKIRKGQTRTGNQDTSDHLILIGDDYCLPFPWRKLARLGHLPDALIRAYSNAAEDV